MRTFRVVSRRTLWIRLALLLIVGLVHCDAEEVSILAPALKCAQTTWDFGAVDAGQVVVHEFTISNTGGTDLLLEKARVTCGSCLTVSGLGLTVSPGEKRTIKVELDTSRRYGKLTQRAYVHTNDPERPVVALSLVGAVRGIWADPQIVSLGRIVRGEHPRRACYVVTAGLEGVEVVSVAASDDALRCTYFPVGTEPQTRSRGIAAACAIQVEWVGTGKHIGKYSADVVVQVRANRGTTEEFKIPVQAYILGEFTVRPGLIFFGVTKPGGTVKRECLLTPNMDAVSYDLGAILVTSDHPGVANARTLKARSDTKALALEVELWCPPTMRPGMVRGEFLGRVAEENSDVLVVPYVAYVTTSLPFRGEADQPKRYPEVP